jgi:hypothetical protein
MKCNNHEIHIGMNGSVKFVEKLRQIMNIRHVKCKFVVTVV